MNRRQKDKRNNRVSQKETKPVTGSALKQMKEEEDIGLSIAEFANNLETAQILYRRYPELVKSRKMPKVVREALRNRTGGPDQELWDRILVEKGILPEPADTEPEMVPEWVGRTPFMEYELDMFEPHGDTIEQIRLTRREYKKLKKLLAKLRGYGQPDQQSAAASNNA
jgi:hypothetical protein